MASRWVFNRKSLKVTALHLCQNTSRIQDVGSTMPKVTAFLLVQDVSVCVLSVTTTRW